ncbi:hypothetical protein [Latilactobacillus sakei]|uniref:hypothetical protein n=1 Tax=Latilactobacillus sakei TaxID=1599 RepID=UPI00202F4874|nr:hypothetical protein [Latilactobacillus sakei]MCM1636274.1 hypothetical protein [Latilactobacillus sakei]
MMKQHIDETTKKAPTTKGKVSGNHPTNNKKSVKPKLNSKSGPLRAPRINKLVDNVMDPQFHKKHWKAEAATATVMVGVAVASAASHASQPTQHVSSSKKAAEVTFSNNDDSSKTSDKDSKKGKKNSLTSDLISSVSKENSEKEDSLSNNDGSNLTANTVHSDSNEIKKIVNSSSNVPTVKSMESESKETGSNQITPLREDNSKDTSVNTNHDQTVKPVTPGNNTGSGSTDNNGNDGNTGGSGNDGNTGNNGNGGNTGGSGNNGNTGNNGNGGNTGGSGNDGNTGNNGDGGNTGGSGNDGNTGNNGNGGNTGGSGNNGNTGNNGNGGNTGGSGNDGNTGNNGNDGNTGGSGNDGNTGNNGDGGNTGGSGNDGNTGNNGDDGNTSNNDETTINGGNATSNTTDTFSPIKNVDIFDANGNKIGEESGTDIGTIYHTAGQWDTEFKLTGKDGQKYSINQVVNVKPDNNVSGPINEQPGVEQFNVQLADQQITVGQTASLFDDVKYTHDGSVVINNGNSAGILFSEKGNYTIKFKITTEDGLKTYNFEKKIAVV